MNMDGGPPDEGVDAGPAADGAACRASTAMCLVSCTSNLQCAHDGRSACVAGSSVTGRSVFVTSMAFGVGAINGSLAAADALCAGAAWSAGRTGSYRAWLSTAGVSAVSRFNDDARPLIMAHASNVPTSPNPDVTVALTLSDTLDGSLLSSLVLSELGTAVPQAASVWTGTAADGSIATTHCDSWTNTTSGATGVAGRAASGNGGWTFAPPQACNTVQRLYCIEE
jgi:hypothetical protein